MNTFAKVLTHNDVVEHVFSTTEEKDKGIKGRDTLLYSCVRMCAKEGEKEGSGQGGYTQKFFALPSITYHRQS